jgi:hypothetical protein
MNLIENNLIWVTDAPKSGYEGQESDNSNCDPIIPFYTWALDLQIGLD